MSEKPKERITVITFENDYSCGAHPAVLERLLQTNLVPQPGYGFDAFSDGARRKLRAACACPEAEIHCGPLQCGSVCK